MGETEFSIRKMVNSSGFPFQLWIGEHIRRTSAKHGWEVLGVETRWFDAQKQRDEFIDLVLGHQSLEVLRVVIEAKRVRDGMWIFLQPSNAAGNTRSFRYFWTSTDENGKQQMGWHRGSFKTEVPVSSFCVVRPQNL